jgi:prepilin-type N-terminal cleavage/methylation domain-containing protein
MKHVQRSAFSGQPELEPQGNISHLNAESWLLIAIPSRSESDMRTPSPSRGRRWSASAGRGFTLIELLVAIVIIGVLIALLLPAINGARRVARDTQVQAEISRLSSALSDFKAKYGINPPSIHCMNPGPDGQAFTVRPLVQQLWPQFDFTRPGN